MIIDNTLGGLEKINEVVSRKGNTLYIMKGIFTEFLKKNRNDRIYTPEKFLPHLSELLERKELLKVVYGEFDHPDVFDTSLSRISHTVHNAWYVKEENRVDGEIRLTSTFYGKEARSLVDDDLPIFVSSRAAGVTESNGEVTVKKLFTYDAVGDPQLVRPLYLQVLGVVGVHRQGVPALRRDHEFPLPHSQQIVLLHQPQYPLVVRRKARVA